MISHNLSVHKWTIRVLKFGIAASVVLSLASCSDDDEDLLGNWVQLDTPFGGVPRSGAVAVVLNEKAYVGTGYDNEDIDDDNIDKLKDMYEFDGNSWKQLAYMPAEAVQRDKAVGFAAAGKIYVGTGSGETSQNNRLADFWALDPVANTWTRVADFTGGKRYGAIAFSIGNKGYVGTGNNGGWLNDLWEYNPATDSWTEKANLAGQKREGAVVFVMNDKAYVCTGINNGRALDDFCVYDPAQNTWAPLRDIADTDDNQSYDDDYNIVRSGAVAFVMDSKAYVCTASATSIGSSVWEYDPSLDLWDEKTSFEGAARRDAVGFAINNVGYVTTGRSGTSGYFDDVWRFEPNAEQEDNDN